MIPSYLFDGNSFTGKMVSLLCNRSQVFSYTYIVLGRASNNSMSNQQDTIYTDAVHVSMGFITQRSQCTLLCNTTPESQSIQLKQVRLMFMHGIHWISYMNISLTCLSCIPCMNISLTHWGRVTLICISKLIIIGSDNGLSLGRRQAIIWTNAGIWSMGPLGTNFSEILIEIYTFSFKKMHLKMSSAKWRLFGLGLNVLTCLSCIPCMNTSLTCFRGPLCEHERPF